VCISEFATRGVPLLPCFGCIGMLLFATGRKRKKPVITLEGSEF